jgi:hypothetical protein
MTSPMIARPQSVPHPYTVELGTTHVVEVKNGGLYVGIYVLTKSNRRRGVILPFGIWMTLLESIDSVNGAIDRARGFALGTAESITSYGHMIRSGYEWKTLTTQPPQPDVSGYQSGGVGLGVVGESSINNFFQYEEPFIKSEHPPQYDGDIFKNDPPHQYGESVVKNYNPAEPPTHSQKESVLWQCNGTNEGGQNACGQTGL